MSSGVMGSVRAVDTVPERSARHAAELVALRRDLHAHPELGFAEVRTTRVLCERLAAAGLHPVVLPGGTGLHCDVGAGERATGLRADIDALPVTDAKEVPYRSTHAGIAHACGHDVHTAAVLGAGLVLAELEREGLLPGRVRLIFQPAEEQMPGGALDVIAAGVIEGVDEIFALHCDPRIEVGRVGVREGPITAACDRIRIVLRGPGGHTARPHLTTDLVQALGTLVTELPAALARRVDPRAGLSVVWGRVAAGSAPNAIPDRGEVEGTLRCLDAETWASAPMLVRQLADTIVAPYGASAEVTYLRGVPPVDNEAGCAEVIAEAARCTIGPAAVVSTPQSLGGEDFAWYLEHIPGALGRLGTASRRHRHRGDLHQGSFDVDETAIELGARVLAAAAILALERTAGDDDPVTGS